jgi:hypothetical protein
MAEVYNRLADNPTPPHAALLPDAVPARPLAVTR